MIKAEKAWEIRERKRLKEEKFMKKQRERKPTFIEKLRLVMLIRRASKRGRWSVYVSTTNDKTKEWLKSLGYTVKDSFFTGEQTIEWFGGEL